MTNWTGRQNLPTTILTYGSGIWGDSQPYGGLVIENTSWSGRTPIAQEGGLLLINAIDRLLINATDKLIISIATTGTSWSGRTPI